MQRCKRAKQDRASPSYGLDDSTATFSTKNLLSIIESGLRVRHGILAESHVLVLLVACPWVLYLIACVMGYLNARGEGLAWAMGAGLITAPLLGLFWGWIYWLIKK